MEIEEMQILWSEMSDQLEQQKKLTNEIIMNMTQEKYSNRFKSISTYETIGAVICFVIALQIIFNFSKLDTWYLMACGIFTLAFLLVMPVLVLRALIKIKRLNIVNKSYKDTLVSYTKSKTNLLQLQKFGIMASFILMFTVAAVFSKIFSNKDFFAVERDIWSNVSIAIALLFVVLVSNWGYGHYKKVANSAEAVIKELE